MITIALYERQDFGELDVMIICLCEGGLNSTMAEAQCPSTNARVCTSLPWAVQGHCNRQDEALSLLQIERRG